MNSNLKNKLLRLRIVKGKIQKHKFKVRNGSEGTNPRMLGAKAGIVAACIMIFTNEQHDTTNELRFNVKRITPFGKWAIHVRE